MVIVAIVTVLVVQTVRAIVTNVVIITIVAILIFMAIMTIVHYSGIEPGIACKDSFQGRDCWNGC